MALPRLDITSSRSACDADRPANAPCETAAVVLSDNVTGWTYLEDGLPVVVLARWSGERAPPWGDIPFVMHPRTDSRPLARSGPHNVLIERADGSRMVRSFHGLRRVTAT